MIKFILSSILEKLYKNDSTRELVLAVMHLSKMITIFYQHYSKTVTATSLLLDLAPHMARLTIKLITQ